MVLGLLVTPALAPSLAIAQPEDDVEVPVDDAPPDIGMDPEPDAGVEGDAAAVESDPAPVRDPRAAKKLADGAAKFVKKGDKLKKRKKDAEAAAEYERALAAYDKSFELHPDARILLITAALEERLGRWYEAAQRYQRALDETEVPLDDGAKLKAAQRLDAAKMYLGLVVLVVSPEGAAIKLNGEEVGAAPLATPLMLRPGEYALEISADEFVTLETKLVIDAGSESERSFELEPVPVVVEKPREAPPPPAPPPPLLPPVSKTPLLIGAGATVLFTGLAVTTGVMAIGKHGTFEDETATAEDRDAAQSSGKNLALATDFFTGAAVVGAAFTVYYYLKIYKPKAKARDDAERQREGAHDEYSRRPPRTRERGPKVLVMPTVQAGGSGIAITGWF